MRFRDFLIIFSIFFVVPIYSYAHDSLSSLGNNMENENICNIIEGVYKILSTKNLNGVKVLGPFQRHILKNGEISNWGMYILPKQILGTPGKLIINFKDNVPNQIILSPSAQQYFKNNLLLKENCIKEKELLFAQTEKNVSKYYDFIHIFESKLDASIKLNFRFFSKEKYLSDGISFNRLVINIIRSE